MPRYPKAPKPFDEASQHNYDFVIKCYLDEKITINSMCKDIQKSVGKKLPCRVSDVSVTSLVYNEGDSKSRITLIIGPLKTKKSVADLEKSIHVGLEDNSVCIRKLHAVDCTSYYQ